MSVSAQQTVAIDGAVQSDPPTRSASSSPPRDDVCCIYVHAGAGYHSIQNERIHLEACNDAAQMAMLILRNGGSAIDAVEMAVKVLEDREITNAGYGSNLAMDGVVECDASIVDHYGRSGAVGAVAQIKNPISLARLVHNHTLQTLTLRRVPPNLLVSQGATDFAIEMGIPILPHDALVSPAARERWVRWRADLKAAERKARKSGYPPQCWKVRNDAPDVEEESARDRMRTQHTRNMLHGYTFLNQSVSPPLNEESMLLPGQENPAARSDPSGTSDPPSRGSIDSWASEVRGPTPESMLSERLQEPVVATPCTIAESSCNAFINSTQKVPTMAGLKEHRALRDVTGNHVTEDVEMPDLTRISNPDFVLSNGRIRGDGSDDAVSASSEGTTKAVIPGPSPARSDRNLLDEKRNDEAGKTPTSGRSTPSVLDTDFKTSSASPGVHHPPLSTVDREDNITDTVGAIAVDSWGNIACAASSGGIGMKYRGRVGPAALVGVGAAVIPVDEGDPDRTSVAVVTSGTGEHMATTMAATVCAERIYQSVKKTGAGEYQDVTEDEALKAMIENDFMDHPSVRNSNSTGAIGILGIKKTKTGVFLYYGHNTDSFAMASMHSDESRPWCAMSRTNGGGQIAQGGRMLRYRTKKKRTPASARWLPG